MMAAQPETLDGGIFQRYLNCNLSVIPLDRKKWPNFELLPTGPDGKAEWGEYQHRKPTQDEIARWSAAGAQVGLVCGSINRNLTLCDLESRLCSPLILWLRDGGRPILNRTWTVESGGEWQSVRGLHFWAYSREPLATTKLRDPDGTIIGDLKAEGGYGVAPPSFHPSGARYRVFTGRVEDILTLDNVQASMQKVIEAFYAKGRAQVATGSGWTPPPKPGMEVRPPLKDRARVMELAKQLAAVKPKIVHSIRKGATWGKGEWQGAGSNSDIMREVLCELLRRGITEDDAKDIYRTWPIRNCCYADVTRPHHGESYLDLMVRKAGEALKREHEANKQTETPEWKITKVVRVEYEGDPEYWVTIYRKEIDREVIVKCQTEDLASDRRFQLACVRYCGWAPKIPPGWQGRNWMEGFANNLMAQATREEVASEATSSGYLRHLVIETLRHARIEKVPPERRGEVSFGWSDERCVYVFPNVLYAKIEARRRNLTPQQLWASVRHLGVERRIIDVGDQRPAIWVFPKEMLNPF